MGLDKDARFVITSITREGIADSLNNVRDPEGDLAPNDERLTDELCQEYADAMQELEFDRGAEEWSYDTYLDKCADLDLSFAKRIWPEDDEEDATMDAETLAHLRVWANKNFSPEGAEHVVGEIVALFDAADDEDRKRFLSLGWPAVVESMEK